ncbi:MAG TPA: hypothetical protein VK324_02130, partial [Tepidisphaeraceae bacterium]|nr:hypothetical protein [Tepidisphaeraceae bacterium]
AAIAAMDGKLAAAAKNESTIGAADAGELVTAPAAPATTAITLYESPAPEASAVVTDIVHVRPEAPGAVDAASTARVADAVEAPVATIAAEEQAIAEERVATTAVAADEVIGAGAARGAGEADAAHVSLVVLNVAGVDRDPITPTEGSGPVEAVTTSGTAIASGADAGEIDIVAEPVIVPASDTIVEAAGDAERVARASEAFELTIAAVKANEVSDTTAAAGGTHEAINAAAASNIEAAAVSMTGEARDVAEVAAADNVGVAATIMAETSEQSTTVEANNAGEAIANVDAAREVIGSERSDDAGEASVTTLVEVIEGPTADGGREVVLATIDPSTAAVGEPIRLVPFEQVVAEIADDAWTGDTFFLRGTTKCGLERRLELRREQGRTWLRIGAPGKPTGWGMYVEAAELLKAVNARPAAGEDEQRMSMAA